MRGAKFIAVNDFSAQKDAWSKNRHILIFMSYMYGSAWHKAMDMFVENYILISRFWAFLEVNVLLIRKSAYLIVFMIGSDNQWPR